MAYRCLMIVNPARISCKNRQLVIETQRANTVPIEDISAIVIESRQSTITAAAMAELSQNGVVIYWCDETHLPSGIALPYAQHCRQLAVLRWQMQQTQPAKNRLWQQIVTAKIKNQAECLALCGKTQEAAYLYSRSKAVNSGDKDNQEAVAAAYYFPALFGQGYSRRAEDARNAALNYAYAILRGYMARCLAVYGFLPCLGLHHDNELNPFNLADDLMEPFRPLADLYVAAHVQEDAWLTPALKGELVNLLNAEILSGNQRHSAAYAMERLVQSLRGQNLQLPKLLEYKQHCYE